MKNALFNKTGDQKSNQGKKKNPQNQNQNSNS